MPAELGPIDPDPERLESQGTGWLDGPRAAVSPWSAMSCLGAPGPGRCGRPGLVAQLGWQRGMGPTPDTDLLTEFVDGYQDGACVGFGGVPPFSPTLGSLALAQVDGPSMRLVDLLAKPD